MKSDQNKEPGINEDLRDHYHNHHHQKHHRLHHHHHHRHHQDSISYDVICDEEVSSLLSKIPNFVAKDIEYTGSESIVAEISTVIDQAPPPILVRHLGSRDTLRGGGWPVELYTERPILDFRKMRKRKFQRDDKESKQSLNFLCRLLGRHSLADFNGRNFKPITVIPLKELPFHQTHDHRPRHRCRPGIAGAQKCQQVAHLGSMVHGGEVVKELAKASETEPLRPCAAVKFANKWTFKEGSGLQNDRRGVKSPTSTGDKSDSDADGSILSKFFKTAESKGRATENNFRNTDNNNKNSFIDISSNNNINNNINNISNNTNNNRLLTFDKIVQEAIASKPTSCQTFHSISNQSWGGVFFPNKSPPPFLPIGSN